MDFDAVGTIGYTADNADDVSFTHKIRVSVVITLFYYSAFSDF